MIGGMTMRLYRQAGYFTYLWVPHLHVNRPVASQSVDFNLKYSTEEHKSPVSHSNLKTKQGNNPLLLSMNV